MPGATDFLSPTMHTVRRLLSVASRAAVVLVLIAGSVLATGAPAQAFNNFSLPLTGGTDFATGFPGCAGSIGPVGIIHDGTNFFAYINTRNPASLPARGHNKQKRIDLRQVSLA